MIYILKNFALKSRKSSSFASITLGTFCLHFHLAFSDMATINLSDLFLFLVIFFFVGGMASLYSQLVFSASCERVVFSVVDSV